MENKYKLTQDGPEVQALLNKIDLLKANQIPGEGEVPVALESLALDGVLYSVLTKAVNDLLNYYTKSETYTKEEVTNALSVKYEKPSNGIPSTDLAQGVIPDVSGFYTKPASGIPASDLADGVIPNVSGKEDTSNKVAAISASPNDTRYPSEKAVADALATKYTKPANGIPASDLASGVIPDVSGFYTKPQSGIPASDLANGVIPDVSGFYTKPASGIPASDLESGVIPSVPTISTDIETDKASDTKTASPKAVYDEVHPAVASSQPQGGFLPNVFYALGELDGSATFALATPTDVTIVNHYYWTFETGSTAPTITWPNGITWLGGSAPEINASKHYEISVLNGIGTFMEV